MSTIGAGCLGDQPRGPSTPHSPDPSDPERPSCPRVGPTVAFEQARIVEASGIARSLRDPCLLWVHNDAGTQTATGPHPVVYVVDGRGHHMGEVWLPVSAVDWEDIGSFWWKGRPYLLVGDVGNNARDRSLVAVHAFVEPDVDLLAPPFNITLEHVQTITVRFPAAPFDCESLAVDPTSDEILFVSKGMPHNLAEDPSGPNQALYTIPLAASLSTGEARFEFRTPLTGVWPWPDGSPASVSGVDLYGRPMTAMDLAPDGRSAVVLTARDALLWTREANEPWVDALRRAPRSIAVPAPGNDQMEGVAFSADGSLLVVTDERGLRNSELTVTRVGH